MHTQIEMRRCCALSQTNGTLQTLMKWLSLLLITNDNVNKYLLMEVKVEL